jgi:hypothetical protein
MVPFVGAGRGDTHTERSLSSYRDGEPVMLTHTQTRAQYYAPRKRYAHGGQTRRTVRRSGPVRDLMATAPTTGTTSSAAEWKRIMADAGRTVYA